MRFGSLAGEIFIVAIVFFLKLAEKKKGKLDSAAAVLLLASQKETSGFQGDALWDASYNKNYHPQPQNCSGWKL